MQRMIWLITVLSLTLAAAAQEKPPAIKLERIAKGLRHLTYVTSDGTPRLFIVEQEGAIHLMQNDKVSDIPYLDISDHVFYGGECGLLSVAFSPKFQDNGYLYVDYTRKNPNLMTVISEFRANPKSNRVDPKSERVLLTIDQPFPNHNGGQLQFGPDGYLYIGMGDGGKHDDPFNHGQDLSQLLAKMLRIDVTPRQGYAIPKDNPFVQTKGARPEIFAWGLRNPWRFSFDRQTGQIYAGDVGQNKWEEVDLIVKGGNYGWRAREGLHSNPNIPPQEPASNVIDPIKEYPHRAYPHAISGKNVADVSITGGYVYRGTKYPSLQGWYIYGDYGSGRIWGLKCLDGKLTGDGVMLESKQSISSFGEDRDGELYVVDHNGSIYRIMPE